MEEKNDNTAGLDRADKKDTFLDRIYYKLKNIRPLVRIFLLITFVVIAWGVVEATRGLAKIIYDNTEAEGVFTALLGLVGLDHSTSAPMLVRYDFETGTMGWLSQVKPGMHAIRYVYPELDTSNTGNHSLGANVKLKGGEANLEEGEVYVNLLETPLEGITAPVNLENVQIRAWVYIPKYVVKDDKIGGIQLFVQDAQGKSLYGSYVNLDPSKIGLWFPITLVPRAGIRPPKGYIGPGFNPREIIEIGLKIDACGLKDCILEGNIFIDSISW